MTCLTSISYKLLNEISSIKFLSEEIKWISSSSRTWKGTITGSKVSSEEHYMHSSIRQEKID